MIDGPRRRRRLDDDGDGEGNGWLSMVALIVVVILVGLLLGAVLARVFGAKTTVVVSPAPLPTIVVTQEPSLTPLPTQSAPPSATPKIRPSASPTALASATPAATALAAPTATPSAPGVRPLPKRIVTPAPTATPIVTPSAKPTLKPTAKPTALPKPRPKPIAPIHSGPQTSSDRAAAVVRLYLDALAHGRTAEARSYLASGEPTESSFMDASANVTSLRTTQNADGTFKVDADLNTSNGEYYITFAVQVSPGGAVIIDHTAIKP